MISSSSNKVQYNCDGSTTEFTFSFPILQSSDLVVILTDSDGNETILTETTNYTVSATGNDYSSGGKITTVETYASGYTITIVREVPLTQETDYRNYDTFPAETIEDALDKLTMEVQQLDEKITRILSLRQSSTYSNLEVPDPEANKYLAWKNDLSGLKNVSIQSSGDLAVSSYIEELLDDADASTAQSTLGISDFIKTLLDDEDASTARNTLEALHNANDTVQAEHINGLTGTGAVDTDNIPEGSTNKYFSDKTLDDLPDGSTYKKVAGVNSSNQITNSSVASKAIQSDNIDLDNVTDGTDHPGAATEWVVPKGLYMMSASDGVYVKVYANGAWHQSSNKWGGGMLWSDGTNVKLITSAAGQGVDWIKLG